MNDTLTIPSQLYMPTKDVIVFYSGRFQPFHAGHIAIFNAILEKFPNSYINTVEQRLNNKNPLPLKLKRQLMIHLGGVPSERIKTERPYNVSKNTLSELGHTILKPIIYIASEKDMIEKQSLLSLGNNNGVKRKRNGKPGALQLIQQLNNQKKWRHTKFDNIIYNIPINLLTPVKDHQFILIGPTFDFIFDNLSMQSASQIRERIFYLYEKNKSKYNDIDEFTKNVMFPILNDHYKIVNPNTEQEECYFEMCRHIIKQRTIVGSGYRKKKTKKKYIKKKKKTNNKKYKKIR